MELPGVPVPVGVQAVATAAQVFRHRGRIQQGRTQQGPEPGAQRAVFVEHLHASAAAAVGSAQRVAVHAWTAAAAAVHVHVGALIRDREEEPSLGMFRRRRVPAPPPVVLQQALQQQPFLQLFQLLLRVIAARRLNGLFVVLAVQRLRLLIRLQTLPVVRFELDGGRQRHQTSENGQQALRE